MARQAVRWASQNASTRNSAPDAGLSKPAAPPTSNPPSSGATRTSTTTSSARAQTPPSPGMVWVNTDTGIYHKSGRWYENTKQGKFMTEDAIKAGYKAAKKE